MALPAPVQRGPWWELSDAGLRFFGHADQVTWAETVELGELLAAELAHDEDRVKRTKLAIGDFLRFGRFKWGEKYAQLAELFPTIPPQSLANMQWVAGRVSEVSRRREVSFEILSTAAGLEPADQEKIVERAERESLSRDDVRELVERVRSERAPQGKAQRAAFRIRLERSLEALTSAVEFSPGPTWSAIVGAVVGTLEAMVKLLKERDDA